MKFLNIKIPFIVVVLFFLIISVGLGIFYWQKIYLPLETSAPSDISLETVQEKCIADVNQMTDEELISQIKELKYPDGETDIVDSDGAFKDRMSWGQNQMSRYLICKAGVNPGNEDIYNKAKKFIEESKFEGEYKETMLDQAYSREPTNTFTFKLALGDTDKICPDELPELCLDGLTTSLKTEENIRRCEVICDYLDELSNNSDKLEKEIISFDNWSNNPVDRENQLRLRMAIAYRYGGENSATRVCDNLTGIGNAEEKEDCIIKINWIKDVQETMKCDDFKEEIISLICNIRE